MYPNNVASQEPLARTLQMQAAKRQQRRAGLGGGMQETVQPYSSLDVQQTMDSMQSADISSPGIAGGQMMRLANMASEPASASPPSEIMTAQFRQTGGAAAPIRMAQTCRPGMACYRGGGTDSWAAGFDLQPGERVVSINGVPVNGAAPMTPAPQMQAPSSTVGERPVVEPETRDGQQPSMPAQPVAPMTPDQALARSDEAFARASSSWYTPGTQGVIDAANQSIIGRVWLNTAAQMLVQQPQLEMLQRQQDEAERNGEMARASQLQNLKLAKEHSIAGFAQTIDAMTAGVGEFEGMDAESREEVATTAIVRFNTLAGTPLSPAQLTQKQEYVRSMITAHDIGRLIAQNGKVVNGQWQWQKGNLEAVDRTLARSYFGKKDDAGKLLLGPALQERMHKDLDMVLARHVESRILSASPDMDKVDAARLARHHAFEAIQNMSGMVNAYQLRYASGEFGVINARKQFDSYLDSDQTDRPRNVGQPVE